MNGNYKKKAPTFFDNLKRSISSFGDTVQSVTQHTLSKLSNSDEIINKSSTHPKPSFLIKGSALIFPALKIVIDFNNERRMLHEIIDSQPELNLAPFEDQLNHLIPSMSSKYVSEVYVDHFLSPVNNVLLSRHEIFFRKLPLDNGIPIETLETINSSKLNYDPTLINSDDDDDPIIIKDSEIIVDDDSKDSSLSDSTATDSVSSCDLKDHYENQMQGCDRNIDIDSAEINFVPEIVNEDEVNKLLKEARIEIPSDSNESLDSHEYINVGLTNDNTGINASIDWGNGPIVENIKPIQNPHYYEHFRRGTKKRNNIKSSTKKGPIDIKNTKPKSTQPSKKNIPRVGGNHHYKKKNLNDDGIVDIERIETIKSIREDKRDAKIKMDIGWKSSMKIDEKTLLLRNSFADMKDKEIAEKIYEEETRLERIEELQEPDMNCEYYDNYFRERQYMEELYKEQKKRHEDKIYAELELVKNSHLLQLIKQWDHNDIFKMSVTSTFVDDLDKIEKFIHDNIGTDRSAELVLQGVARAIEEQPLLLDKCSLFLKDLIMKLKPLALAGDTVRDIVLNIDVLKEDSIVVLAQSISYPELQKMYNTEHHLDLRNEHMRRGKLVHIDPMIQKFVLTRTLRNQYGIAQRYDYAGFCSMELLFQLLSQDVSSMTLTPDQVYSKMCHFAANIHSINLPKDDLVMFKTNIVQDTLYVARAIYLTRRRVSDAMGFVLAPR
jgi:hypothetical protein